MIDKLVELADLLDARGLRVEADMVDQIVLAQTEHMEQSRGAMLANFHQEFKQEHGVDPTVDDYHRHLESLGM